MNHLPGVRATPSDATALDSPLLTTKLFIPPVRPELVARPRLVERLNVGLNRKLTLISAPAGFGKTTLLSEWIQGRGAVTAPLPCHPHFAWVSLDQGDNDPVRFWSYAIAALRTIPSLAETNVGKTSLVSLQSARMAAMGSAPPVAPILTRLINEIADLATGDQISRRYVLILDDYHLIEEQAIHRSLSFLLDHLPPQLHLVIASRADPPLPLSLLRGRGQLTELRAAELRFTPDEAAVFLNRVMGLELSPKEVAALEARTEGWIVGLQMAALSLQRKSAPRAADFVAAFAGSHRYVLDYLTDEVLTRQSQDTQTFLMQTAILTRLCGPLCDAVTKRDDSQEMLEYLEAANLFIIPLDEERRWYRYHHLFADLLHKRLVVTQPDLAPTLHCQASAWYQRAGLKEEAMSHLLAAPDYGRAADLIELHVQKMAQLGEMHVLDSWLQALPEDLVRTRPALCLIYAWCSSPRSFELAERWAQHTVDALASSVQAADARTPLDQATLDGITAQVLDLRANIAQNRGAPPEQVRDLTFQAMELVPESTPSLRASLVSRLGWCDLDMGDEEAADRAFFQSQRLAQAGDHDSLALQAAAARVMIARRQGRLRDAAEICREALQTIVEPVESTGQVLPPSGLIQIELGRILLEWNQLAKAERSLIQGLEVSELFVLSHPARLDAHIALAHLRLAQGELDDLPDLNALAQQHWSWLDCYAAAQQARVWLRLAEHDPRYLGDARQWADGRELKLEEDERCVVESLAVARVRVAQRRAEPPANKKTDLGPILNFLDALKRVLERRGWTDLLIETLIVQALAYEVLGQEQQALASLERALALAEPEGYVRMFIDEGTPMARLLYQVAERGTMIDYVGRLLAAFKVQAANRRQGTEDRVRRVETTDSSFVRRPSSPIEPLSAREIEVLRLMAEGLTNREIARQLIISVSTVKRHTANIYNKLDVHSRTQAVAQAKRLGILLD